ncbi:MAG: zf-HC2 domain-containing protein [Elusimicrobiaceae bacterium]|nr:zf-HC2 domain-containing protein [Elusimicrobiaceae bacterium]
MSPCEREEQVLLYHYGELSDDGRAECERHLKVCGQCRLGLAALAAVGQFKQPRQVPAELVAGVRRRVLPGRLAGWLRGHPWFRYSTVATGLAAGLLAFSGIELGNRAVSDGRAVLSHETVISSRAADISASISAARSSTALAGHEKAYSAYLETNDTDGFFSSAEAMYYAGSETDDVNRLLDNINAIRTDIKNERTAK